MKQAEQQHRRWSIKTDDLPTQHLNNSLQQSLPDDLGTGHSNLFQLDHELSYIESQYTPNQDLSVLNQVENQESKLIVTLSLKGDSKFVPKKGDDIFFSEGYTTITSFNSSLGARHYEANKELVQLRFSLSKDCLQQYFEQQLFSSFFKKSGVHTLSYQPISCCSLIAAQQLLTCSLPETTKKLFMHGQALSILSSELGHLFEQKSDTAKFTNNDKEIARAARNILIVEFNTPPL